jgi:hypothetical protein
VYCNACGLTWYHEKEHKCYNAPTTGRYSAKNLNPSAVPTPRFKLDEDSAKKRAEEVFETLLKVKDTMDSMGIPDDHENQLRSMVISAYLIGCRETIEKANT